ncbi:hypothetical protein D3C72_1418190 [compost metagenome]
MAVQRFDVAQNLPRFLELLGIKQAAAHQKAHGAARIHHVAADTAVQIFLMGNRIQRFGRVRIGKFLLQHARTDFFQVLVDAFEHVGRVFGIGGVQVEQHVHVVGNRAWPRTGAHAHQAEHGQVVRMHGKQNLAGKDESHGDDARRAVVLFAQEIRAQVQVAVFRFVIAGRRFNILDFVFARQGDVIDGLDPGPFIIGRVGQVDPHRFGIFEVCAAVDRHLVEPAIL